MTLRAITPSSGGGGGGGGGEVNFATADPSGVVTVEFLDGFEDAYKNHEFSYGGVQMDTDGRYFGIQVSIDGGTSWIASGYEYDILQQTAGPTKRGGTANWGYLQYSTIGSDTNEFASGHLIIHNSQDASLNKRITFHSAYHTTGGLKYNDSGSIIVPTTSAINAVRFGDVWLGTAEISQGHISHRRF